MSDDRDTLIRLHRSTLAALHKKREASTDDRERERLRKAIGDETRTIAKLSGPGPGRPPKERIVVAPKRRRKKADTLEEDLAYRLAELDRVALQAEMNGAWTAVVTAHKSAIDLRQQIEAQRRPAPLEDPTAGMSDAEITAALVEAVAGWSEDALDAVEEAIRARRGIRGEPVRLRLAEEG